MTWTKKHDRFARACNFSQSMEHLTRWIMRRSCLNEPKEIEIDLRLFNKEVGKQRFKGEYHRKTLSTAINRLDSESNGMIVITKRYSPWIFKILVRPLFLVEKMQSAKSESAPMPTVGNPMFSEQHKQQALKQQQQIISNLDSLFTKVGIRFDNAALNRIWKLSGKSMTDITSAIELLLHRHSTQAEAIKNPQGFIINCLKYAWQKSFDLFYQAELPQFKSATAISNYVRSAATVTNYGNTAQIQT